MAFCFCPFARKACCFWSLKATNKNNEREKGLHTGVLIFTGVWSDKSTNAFRVTIETYKFFSKNMTSSLPVCDSVRPVSVNAFKCRLTA